MWAPVDWYAVQVCKWPRVLLVGSTLFCFALAGIASLRVANVTPGQNPFKYIGSADKGFQARGTRLAGELAASGRILEKAQCDGAISGLPDKRTYDRWAYWDDQNFERTWCRDPDVTYYDRRNLRSLLTSSPERPEGRARRGAGDPTQLRRRLSASDVNEGMCSYRWQLEDLSYWAVKLVFEPDNSDTDLFSLDAIKGMCDVDEAVRALPTFPGACDTVPGLREYSCEGDQCLGDEWDREDDPAAHCCPSRSLGTYAAWLAGKKACADIDADDVRRLKELAQDCAGEYHVDVDEAALGACANPDEVSGYADCPPGWVEGVNATTGVPLSTPSKCQEGNAVYDVLAGLVDLHYLDSDTTGSDKPRFARVLVPGNDWDNGYEFNIAVDPLLRPLSGKSFGGARLKAYDNGAKFSMFSELLVIVDIPLIMAGCVVIFFMLWLYAGTAFFAGFAMLQFIFSMLVGGFLFLVVLWMPFFPFLNVTAVFICIGIAADDIFVFLEAYDNATRHMAIQYAQGTDTYHEALAAVVRLLPEGSLERSQSARMSYASGGTYQFSEAEEAATLAYVLRDAGGSTLVTSLTTAGAFFATSISAITAIRCFGIFCGMVVIADWFLLCTYIPAVVLTYKKHIVLGCCRSICAPCSSLARVLGFSGKWDPPNEPLGRKRRPPPRTRSQFAMTRKVVRSILSSISLHGDAGGEGLHGTAAPQRQADAAAVTGVGGGPENGLESGYSDAEVVRSTDAPALAAASLGNRDKVSNYGDNKEKRKDADSHRDDDKAKPGTVETPRRYAVPHDPPASPLNSKRRGDIDAASEGLPEQLPALSIRFDRALSPWITHKYLRYVWPIALLGLGAGLSTQAPRLDFPVSGELQMLPDDHPIEHYCCIGDQVRDEFGIGGVDKCRRFAVDVLWGVVPEDNGDFYDPSPLGVGTLQLVDIDPTTKEAQRFLKKVCERAEDADWFDDGSDAECDSAEEAKCTVELLIDAMSTPCAETNLTSSACCGVPESDFPYEPDVFNECLAELQRAQGNLGAFWHYGPDKEDSDADDWDPPVVLRMRFPTRRVYDDSFRVNDAFQKELRAWEERALRDAPAELSGGYATSPNFGFYAMLSAIGESAYGSTGLSAALAGVVLMCMTQNAVVATLATATIALIIGTIVGILVLNGWSLGVLESICFATGIGMACDFVAHLGYSYRQSMVHGEADTRTGLVRIAVMHMAPATSAAALSTSTMGVLMLFSGTQFTRNFGEFILLLMSFSWTYAFFLLLPTLVIIGPLDNCGELRSLIALVRGCVARYRGHSSTINPVGVNQPGGGGGG